MKTMILARYTILVCTLMVAPHLVAAEFQHAGVEQLVASEQRPDGVVFELITWDDDSWTWAAPMLLALTKQLRQKFPELDVALVSHGAEMFALTNNRVDLQRNEFQQLFNLSQDQVDIHVCGNFAEGRGLGAEDFPGFVDVAPSAPAQLSAYRELGFIHLVLERPRATD